MRWIVGLVGVGCAGMIVWIVGSFGYSSAQNHDDAWVMAFYYAVPTALGFGGGAVVARLWKHRDRALAGIVFIVSSVALVLSLSNSLGAMAKRANETQALRSQNADKVASDRVTLARKEAERAAMAFKPTDGTAVSAARSAAEEASKAVAKECGIQGTLCRKNQAAEQAALKALTEASQNKTATDAARVIEGEIKELKASIDKAGPVLDGDSQGSAMAQIFSGLGMTAAALSVWQRFLLNAIVEIAVMLSFIVFERLGQHERAGHAFPGIPLPSRYLEAPHHLPDGPLQQADDTPRKQIANYFRGPALPTPAQQLDAAIDAPQETPASVDELTDPQPKQRTKARVPRSTVSRSKPAGKPRKSGVAASADVRDVGDIPTWFRENYETTGGGAGKEIQARPLWQAYCRWCEARDLQALSEPKFGQAMLALAEFTSRQKTRFWHAKPKMQLHTVSG